MKFKAEEIEKEVGWLEPPIIEDSLTQLIENLKEKVEGIVEEWLQNGNDKIFIVGCGGSLIPGMLGKYLLDKYSSIHCETYTGFEFVTRTPRMVDRKSSVILISHSGGYEEILGSVKLAKERGAATLGITNDSNTELAKSTDEFLAYDSGYKVGAVTLSKQALIYILCGNIMKAEGDPKGERILADLKTITPKLVHVRKGTKERGKALAKEHKNTNMFYVLGSGPLYSVAYLFSVSLLMEMLWTDACPVHAGEFRHGFFEVVDQDTSLIFLLGTDDSRHVTERALDFSKKYNAKTIAFDAKDFPQMDDALTPMPLSIALQWFAHYLSVEKLHPLTTRRYMGVVPY